MGAANCLVIGRTISHYRVVAKLGEGGMGVVYRAEDFTLNRQVALKFLAKDALRAGQQERFLNEAKAAARLSHPNICPVHAIEQADGELFLAMALLEGRSLADILAEGPMPIEDAIDIAIQIGSGLDAAHREGVVHRDVTPRNVIVSNDGHASVLDFGLALVLGDTRLTTEGATVGTAAYMSPEQTLGSDVDRRADVWALGVVLFEMIAGRRPFGGEHQLALMYEVVHEAPAPLQVYRPECSDELGRIVRLALTKDLESRYQSAGDMVADLKNVRTSSTSTHSLTSPSERIPAQLSTIEKVRPKRKRFGRRAPLGQDYSSARKTTAVAAVAVAAVLVVVAGIPFVAGDGRQAEGLPEVKHVAVLPFATAGGDARTQALCDGLVEVLTARLSQLDQLGDLIIVPASELRSRDVVTVEQARAQFGINLAITGSVQDWGDTLELTSALVDARSLRQIDATNLQIHKGDLSSLRLGAISRIVNILELNLSAEDVDADRVAETNSAEAYTAYLEGLGYMRNRGVQGNTERAVDSLERSVRADAGYATAYAWLSEAYFELAEEKNDLSLAAKAIAVAEKAVETDGASAISRAKLGEAYARSGRTSEAIRELDRAQELAPENFEALISLGRLYPRLGQAERAEAALRKAVHLRPTDWRGYTELGLLLGRQGRRREAIQAYSAAVDLAPGVTRNYQNLGASYRLMGRFEEAKAALEKTLRLDPESYYAHEELSLVYLMQASCSEAVEHSKKAVSLNPNLYRLHGNLARAYGCEPGHTAEQRATLAEAIRLTQARLVITPEDYLVRSLLAGYWARVGDRERALAEIDKIPSLPQQPSQIRLQVAKAYQLAGLGDRAMSMLNGVLDDGFSLEDAPYHGSVYELRKNPNFVKVAESAGRAEP